MECWLVSIDFRLTVDVGKIVGYMTKYVTKPEASRTKGAQAMINRVLNSTVDEGQTVQAGLKRVRIFDMLSLSLLLSVNSFALSIATD